MLQNFNLLWQMNNVKPIYVACNPGSHTHLLAKVGLFIDLKIVFVLLSLI